MSIEEKTIQDSLKDILEKRKQASLYRSLQVSAGLVDFCSNDYLSFSRSPLVQEKLKEITASLPLLSGATGSRSISGNTAFVEELERGIASFHQAEAGLIFNSGYDANLGLFSCLARKDDYLVTDELIHASIIDGCRLSYANRLRFAHNDTADLEKKLRKARESMASHANIFVAVESVYSMDGDMAPLPEFVAICKTYNASLIVDEAHATGIFGEKGRGLVSAYALENDVFARVHTFGKAIGCHGAIIIGSRVLREYLVNFARSFIFTTALPLHSLATVRSAYGVLQSDSFSNKSLHELVARFREDFHTPEDVYLIESSSPIQSLVIPGAERAKKVAATLQDKGFDIRAIVSPSVPAGRERLRISLHLHNTTAQVDELKHLLQQILFS